MKSYIVHIEGMHCAHCVANVKKALSEVDGVERVEVDLKKGTAKIEAEEGVAASEVSDAIEDVGFSFVSMEEMA